MKEDFYLLKKGLFEVFPPSFRGVFYFGLYLVCSKIESEDFTMKNRNTKTKKLVSIALFAAIATVLMFIEFNIPMTPPFLKVDISGAVILIAVLTLGLKEAVSALLIKDLIHLLSTQTGGVGELADFIMLTAMAVALWLITRNNKDVKKVVIGCVVATAALIAAGAITNAYMLIPFYAKVMMPVEAILDMCQKVNPNITSITSYVVWGVVPFNLVKGVILSIITVLLYKKSGKMLEKMK